MFFFLLSATISKTWLTMCHKTQSLINWLQIFLLPKQALRYPIRLFPLTQPMIHQLCMISLLNCIVFVVIGPLMILFLGVMAGLESWGLTANSWSPFVLRESKMNISCVLLTDCHVENIARNIMYHSKQTISEAFEPKKYCKRFWHQWQIWVSSNMAWFYFEKEKHFA